MKCGFVRLGLLGGLMLGLAATPAATDEQPEGSQSVLVEVGREYYVRYCSSCHGVEGRGDGPVAESLRTRPADLTQIAKRRGGKFPDAEIARYIDGRAQVASHGSREMPIWGRRFGKELAEGSTAEEVVRGHLLILVEYLKSIQE